jgi:hypothetical protein
LIHAVYTTGIGVIVVATITRSRSLMMWIVAKVLIGGGKVRRRRRKVLAKYTRWNWRTRGG